MAWPTILRTAIKTRLTHQLKQNRPLFMSRVHIKNQANSPRYRTAEPNCRSSKQGELLANIGKQTVWFCLPTTFLPPELEPLSTQASVEKGRQTMQGEWGFGVGRVCPLCWSMIIRICALWNLCSGCMSHLFYLLFFFYVFLKEFSYSWNDLSTPCLSLLHFNHSLWCNPLGPKTIPTTNEQAPSEKWLG